MQITNTEKLGEVKKIMGGEIAPLLEGATMIRDGTVFVVTKSKKEEVCKKYQKKKETKQKRKSKEETLSISANAVFITLFLLLPLSSLSLSCTYAVVLLAAGQCDTVAPYKGNAVKESGGSQIIQVISNEDEGPQEHSPNR